jgi:hypothetical protein
VIELPATVIRDVNELNAMLEAELGVFRGSDPFDREWNFVFRLDAVDGFPVEPGLEFAA